LTAIANHPPLDECILEGFLIAHLIVRLHIRRSDKIRLILTTWLGKGLVKIAHLQDIIAQSSAAPTHSCHQGGLKRLQQVADGVRLLKSRVEPQVVRALTPMQMLEAELTESAVADVVKNFSLGVKFEKWTATKADKQEKKQKLSYEKNDGSRVRFEIH
jgi:hypothetical protein